jgi:hypothetical protein
MALELKIEIPTNQKFDRVCLYSHYTQIVGENSIICNITSITAVSLTVQVTM